MKPINTKIRHVTLIIIFTLIAFCQTANAQAVPQVNTDKNIYDYGEPIKVNFSGAPGDSSDWICIVPTGSPDNEAGDYKYMPQGLSQSVLTFDPPAPGKYEVRAYYNYSRKGYAVSARYAFSIVSGPETTALLMARMERKIDPNKPQESNIHEGEGIVYIFRESIHFSDGVEAEIKANGKVIAVIPNSSYFLVPVPAGDVKFTTGSLTALNIRENKKEGVWTKLSGEATIQVKASYVYYLKLSVSFRGAFDAFLEQVPHQDGANSIENNKLKLLK